MASRKAPGGDRQTDGGANGRAARPGPRGSHNPEVDKVVRWRCIDLCGQVEKRFAVAVCERTIGKWLDKLGLTRVQPRPRHPKKDEAAQGAF